MLNRPKGQRLTATLNDGENFHIFVSLLYRFDTLARMVWNFSNGGNLHATINTRKRGSKPEQCVFAPTFAQLASGIQALDINDYSERIISREGCNSILHMLLLTIR